MTATHILMKHLTHVEAVQSDARQRSILDWCKAAFAAPNGDLDEALSETRCLRLVEEVVELAQVQGLSPEQLHRQIDITFARPVGTIHSEIGGVGITLNAYCEAVGESYAQALDDEITRCHNKPIEHFQRRQKEKREAGL